MKRVTFQLDDLLAARVKALAALSGVSPSQYVSRVLRADARPVEQLQAREIARFAAEIARRAEVKVLERMYEAK